MIKQVESLQQHDIHTIWVGFDDSTVGQTLRLSKRQIYKPEIFPIMDTSITSWTTIQNWTQS